MKGYGNVVRYYRKKKIWVSYVGGKKKKEVEGMMGV